jgi:hypothetical protein
MEAQAIAAGLACFEPRGQLAVRTPPLDLCRLRSIVPSTTRGSVPAQERRRSRR